MACSKVECWASGLIVTDCLCQLCSLKCAQICLKYMKMYVFGLEFSTIVASTSVYKRGVWDLPAQKLRKWSFLCFSDFEYDNKSLKSRKYAKITNFNYLDLDNKRSLLVKTNMPFYTLSWKVLLCVIFLITYGKP